ncbi:MAG: rRNA methyltransferase, partial [Verrucomicrobiaceae bacterium]
VQEAAIASTRGLLAGAGLSERVTLIHGSHGTMESHAPLGSVAVVMFNLGYLPGEDHALTTESAETLSALDAAGRVLRPGGILSIVCYPGHPAGAIEAEAVEAWLAGKTAVGWRVARYGAIGTKRPAPFLLVARIG